MKDRNCSWETLHQGWATQVEHCGGGAGGEEELLAQERASLRKLPRKRAANVRDKSRGGQNWAEVGTQTEARG